jgi:pimeloyl-ACP methyl ester carboxylesterase
MLPTRTHGNRGPLLVCLHWLGGSARTWTELGETLAAAGMTVVAIDLPGFGDAVDIPGYTPAETAASVIATIQTLRAADPGAPWLLAGHSMGGKIATLVARAAADGMAGLENLTAMVMTSPSPPEPEPMKNSRREELLETMGYSSGDPAEDRKRAEKMIDGGIGKLPLTAAVRERSVEDVLRLNRAALRAWLQEGSKEDCGAHVGVLPLPVLIFAGDSERALGPETQQNVTLPHFASGKLLVLEAMGHLAPIERPADVAAHVVDFVQSLGIDLHPPTRPLDAAFQSVLDGPRTAPQTRAVMNARLNDAAHRPPQVFTDEELHTLGALIDSVVPEASANLAARLDRQLATSKGDGWRYDALPADPAAWKQGLASLDAAAHRAHGAAFLALPAELRHALLLEAQQGQLGRGALGALHVGESAHAFTAAQMQRWFEDVRAELTRLYVSDPRTMDRIGFTGFADDPAGFTQIRLEDQAATPEELAEVSR